jgi:hypothetical protein
VESATLPTASGTETTQKASSVSAYETYTKIEIREEMRKTKDENARARVNSKEDMQTELYGATTQERLPGGEHAELNEGFRWTSALEM